MSGSSNLDGFRDGSKIAVQLLFCWVLPPELLQYSSQHSCVIVSSFFFCIRLGGVHEVHPYSSTDTAAALKKLPYNLSDRSDFHMTDNLSIAIHAFATSVLVSFLVHKTLLPWCVKLSTSFRETPFIMEILPLWLKCMFSVLSAF